VTRVWVASSHARAPRQARHQCLELVGSHDIGSWWGRVSLGSSADSRTKRGASSFPFSGEGARQTGSVGWRRLRIARSRRSPGISRSPAAGAVSGWLRLDDRRAGLGLVGDPVDDLVELRHRAHERRGDIAVLAVTLSIAEFGDVLDQLPDDVLLAGQGRTRTIASGIAGCLRIDVDGEAR